MIVVACTAGLIANCDSYLVHCVCMQGCMFRECMVVSLSAKPKVVHP